MANYNTRTKVFVLDVTSAADTVTGSLAKVVNDYIQTLDSTTGAIQEMGMVPFGSSKIFVWIVHLG